jgi:uncharacterized protein YjiS (DUF1127 family)
MYIKFAEPLNAKARTLRAWEKLTQHLASRWVHLVQQHRYRKASGLLAELNERLLRDIGSAEAAPPSHPAHGARDAQSPELRKQLLRAI